ncbi:MAG: hypothetical protein QM697_09895 [Lachnospiraceae bacterium]
MTKKEFEQKQTDLQKLVGQWEIVINAEVLSDFAIGCFYDEKTQCWKVYINNERGRHRIRLETKDEGEAFEELFSMINYEIENNKYI